jgi:hypothetical protein
MIGNAVGVNVRGFHFSRFPVDSMDCIGHFFILLASSPLLFDHFRCDKAKEVKVK